MLAQNTGSNRFRELACVGIYLPFWALKVARIALRRVLLLATSSLTNFLSLMIYEFAEKGKLNGRKDQKAISQRYGYSNAGCCCFIWTKQFLGLRQ